MENKNSNYKKLDRTKLKFKKRPVSAQEALKDIIPIPWGEAVLHGERKVEIVICK